MESSPASQPEKIWKALSMNNCMWMQTPGRYLLRKNNWNDSKYFTNLTGIWDGSCGRIKLYVTDKEEFMTEEQVQQHESDTGDCDHKKRKMLVHKLKQLCVMYNNLVDGVAVLTRNSRISKEVNKECKEILLTTTAKINAVIIAGYDSFTLEKQGDTLEDLAATLIISVLGLQAALSTKTALESSSDQNQ